MSFTEEEWQACARVLQYMADNPGEVEQHERLKTLVAKIHKQGIKLKRRDTRQEWQAEQRRLLGGTAIVRNAIAGEAQWEGSTTPALPVMPAIPEEEFVPVGSVDAEGGRADAGTEAPAGDVLPRARPCYVCKANYRELHFFYHQMCPECAAFNYAKREQHADLRGRVALLTGGRVKIGYMMGLRLLQDGATLYLTTRFPVDAAARYSREPDFEEWKDRLHIVGLDLRSIPEVEQLADWLGTQVSGLDIIMHNAAQTVKRPLGFYRHLLEAEAAASPAALAAGLVHRLGTGDSVVAHAAALEGVNPSALKNIRAGAHLLETLPHYPGHIATTDEEFPEGIIDGDGQQLDARAVHSWMLKLEEVSTVEMVEVQVVNSVAPFVLNSRLKPLMERSRFERRFIVNVSAMEGQFTRKGKTPYHPHTNMAKAALNMMTRTCAADYARSGIYMNSVDTGWITDESPLPKKQRLQQDSGFYAPLDITDGMARIYDPVATGVNDPADPLHGHFLKDYRPFPW